MSQRREHRYHQFLGILVLTIICSRSLKIDFSKDHLVITKSIMCRDSAHLLSISALAIKIKKLILKKSIMKLLNNKVAILTGSGSGIGKATALLFGQQGAKVIVSDINEEHGEATMQEIKSKGGEASFFKADSSSPAENEALVTYAIVQYGQLDIAVNNAGTLGPLTLTGDYPLDGWKKTIDINLSGVFYALRYQIPAMIKSGGSIVNLASVMGQVGTKFSPAYVAAKHGVVGLTKAAALEYGDKNIRVNCVGPSYIKTPLVMKTVDDATLKEVVRSLPLGRLGEPEEVAELILWLASTKSSFITGSFYAVDGGYLAQ